MFSVFLWKYDISDHTLVDRTSNFFFLCTDIKICLYNNSYWVEPSMNIHEERVKSSQPRNSVNRDMTEKLLKNTSPIITTTTTNRLKLQMNKNRPSVERM